MTTNKEQLFRRMQSAYEYQESYHLDSLEVGIVKWALHDSIELDELKKQRDEAAQIERDKKAMG
jgi:hypothetical protein